jgi:hypothetical protein
MTKEIEQKWKNPQSFPMQLDRDIIGVPDRSPAPRPCLYSDSYSVTVRLSISPMEKRGNEAV